MWFPSSAPRYDAGSHALLAVHSPDTLIAPAPNSLDTSGLQLAFPSLATWLGYAALTHGWPTHQLAYWYALWFPMTPGGLLWLTGLAILYLQIASLDLDTAGL